MIPLESFDVVFAGEIIEHIYDTDAFLQEVYRVLKYDGDLILTTPNLATLGRRILLLFGKNPLIENSLRRDDSSGHIRYFIIETLLELLSLNGFKVVKVASTVINFTKNGSIKTRMLAKLFPSLGSTIIIKAIKK